MREVRGGPNCTHPEIVNRAGAWYCDSGDGCGVEIDLQKWRAGNFRTQLRSGVRILERSSEGRCAREVL